MSYLTGFMFLRPTNEDNYLYLVASSADCITIVVRLAFISRSSGNIQMVHHNIFIINISLLLPGCFLILWGEAAFNFSL